MAMSEISLDQQIDTLETYIKYLSEAHISRLDRIVKLARGVEAHLDEQSVVSNLMREVHEQMEFVKSFRRR